MTRSTRLLAASWGAFVVGLLGWVGAAVYIGMMMPTETTWVGSTGLVWGIFSGGVGLGLSLACRVRGGSPVFAIVLNAGLIVAGATLLVGAAVLMG